MDDRTETDTMFLTISNSSPNNSPTDISLSKQDIDENVAT
jgi:hypothetical protein